jgi:HAE1 family hydrophobic/amphiphilic exporter-1
MFRDVTSDAQNKGLQASLDIDRDKANLLGVQMSDVRTALYATFGERQVSTIYSTAASYYVILEAADADRQFEDALGRISVRSRSGQLVQLSSIASIKRTVGPLAVNHQGQLQAITLSFNLAPDVPLGDATNAIAEMGRDMKLPGSIITKYGGDAAVFQDSQSSQLILIVAAVGVIYVLLGVLYESFIHPITILAGLPSAAVGALLTLRLFGLDLTMIAIIGILMLIGIVKKNAIMMIDFALDAQRNHGMKPAQAIRRRRAAPAAGPGGVRRPDLLAGDHLVHHPGDLPVPRPLQRHRPDDRRAHGHARSRAGAGAGPAQGRLSTRSTRPWRAPGAAGTSKSKQSVTAVKTDNR